MEQLTTADYIQSILITPNDEFISKVPPNRVHLIDLYTLHTPNIFTHISEEAVHEFCSNFATYYPRYAEIRQDPKFALVREEHIRTATPEQIIRDLANREMIFFDTQLFMRTLIEKNFYKDGTLAYSHQKDTFQEELAMYATYVKEDIDDMLRHGIPGFLQRGDIFGHLPNATIKKIRPTLLDYPYITPMDESNIKSLDHVCGKALAYDRDIIAIHRDE